MYCVRRRSTREILRDAIRSVMKDGTLIFSNNDRLGDRAMLERTVRTFGNDAIRYVYILPEELYDGMTFGELLGGCDRTLFQLSEAERKRCEEAWDTAPGKETPA